MRKVLEDSKIEYERNQWDALDVQLVLLHAGDVAIPQLEEPEDVESQATPCDPTLEGQSWTWTSTVLCTPEYVSSPSTWVGADAWSPSPPRPPANHGSHRRHRPPTFGSHRPTSTS